MKVTLRRVSLYLTKVKTLVNYHVKLRSKTDREVNLRILKISYLLAQTENELRNLQKYLIKVENERANKPDNSN
jgi:hypothetical protein